MIRLALLAAVLGPLALAPHANAQAQIAFMGAGTQSCAVFGQQYQKNPQLAEAVYFSWAQGYMSAVNYFAGSAQKFPLNLAPVGWPVPNQEAFIRDYCAGHPLDDYTMAVLKLMGRLKAAAP